MNAEALESAERLVEEFHDLPPLPSIVVRLGELLSNPRTSAQKVGELLSSEPSIASKILGIANSAYYGFPERISTLSHAVVVLGFNTVRNIVLTSGIMRALNKFAREARYDHFRFWKHSVACGAASKVIASRLGGTRVEEYFIFGLLHDIGKLVIQGGRPGEARRVAELVAGGKKTLDAERIVLGTTHAEIGGALLARWRLPAVFDDAVRHHHAPALAREDPKAAAVVHVADVLVHALLLSGSEGESLPSLSAEAWAIVRLFPETLPGIFQEIFELIERAEAFLDLGR